MKKYKFELQKAINTPVNAISRVSGAHLLDKLTKLVRLLARQPVDVGTNRVSVAAHPAAYDFCKDLLARKIVVSHMLPSNSFSSLLKYLVLFKLVQSEVEMHLHLHAV